MRPAERLAAIETVLVDGFAPAIVHVMDESHRHKGHPGARDGRGHFRVRVVSDRFRGLAPLARHRAVYAAMGDLMATDVHALSIEALTFEEAGEPA